jgi:hypothetical protein
MKFVQALPTVTLMAAKRPEDLLCVTSVVQTFRKADPPARYARCRMTAVSRRSLQDDGGLATLAAG